MLRYIIATITNNQLLPIINAGLNSLNKKGFLYVLLWLTILNLYFGWFQKQPNFNGDGYNASQMLYLYVIGRYIYRFVNIESLRSRRIYILLIWFASSLLWGVIQNIHNTIHSVPHWNGWAYNNPVVMASSLALFLMFEGLEIKPVRMINTCAAGMLGVLLIHTNRYMGKYIYDGVRELIYSPILNHSMWLQVIGLVVIAVVVMVVLTILDIPRTKAHKWLMSKFEFSTHL